MEAVKENKTDEVIILNEAEPIATSQEVTPTREDLKKNGWSAKELDAAEKRGMIKAPEVKPEAEVKEDAAPEQKKEESKEVKEEVKEEKKPASNLPDFTITDPAKEKVFLDTFGSGTPQRAMYFRMKNERQARQQAEARSRELEDKLSRLEAEIKTVKPKMEVDENGNEIDPEDRPLTLRQIKEMNAREAEERQRQDSEIRQRGNVVADALKNQEEFAKEIYQDYDETVGLAKDLMQNLDSLVAEEWKKDRIIELVRDLQVKAANADKYGIDKYNAALISYELGKFHPNYGVKADTNGKSERPETKANGSLTPEQMERIKNNTQRRGSSASIPGGGGSRTVSAEDVGLKELNAMTPTQRSSFKTKHPDRYQKLVRG